VVVFAYQEVGYVCLEELLEQDAEVVGLVTHADAPGENVWWRSVADLARRHGIPVFVPENVNAPEFVQTLRELRPDLIFSFYFRDLLSDEILAIPPHGGLNLHGSLLPHYRGRAPVNWVLVNGEHETGVTLHYMVRRADAGDIVAQRRVAIAFEDTAATLYEKIVAAARVTLREVWPLLRDGRAPRYPQDISHGSYYGRRRPEDGQLDWSWPAIRCYHLVRAVTHPFPGAFTHLDGRKLWIWWAVPISDFGLRISEVGTSAPTPPGPGPGTHAQRGCASAPPPSWIRSHPRSSARGPAPAAGGTPHSMQRRHPSGGPYPSRWNTPVDAKAASTGRGGPAKRGGRPPGYPSCPLRGQSAPPLCALLRRHSEAPK
jgi:methionyl-tRNA formyltransferase